MVFPNIDPIIISFGPMAISWYSLSYVVGIMLGWLYANKIIQIFTLHITKQNLDDFIVYAVVGIVIGGRLGYVLLYNPYKYFTNPIEIFKTYEGGMSYHGGMVGVAVAAYLFCKRYKINFLRLFDVIATTAPIGLFLGRIANFINGELYGRVTNSPLGIIFPTSDLQPRHPSQLYEAFFEGIILFVILFCITFKYRTINKPGFNSGVYLVFYAIFRILIEMVREPDVHIGFIAGYCTMGQLLSIPLLCCGIYLIRHTLCKNLSRKRKKGK